MYRFFRLHTSLKGKINSQQSQSRFNNLEPKREKIYNVRNESTTSNSNSIGVSNNKTIISESKKSGTASVSNSSSKRNQQELTRTTKRKKRIKKWPKLAKIYSPQNTVPKRITAPPSIKPIIKPCSSLPKEAQRAARKEAKADFMEWLKENAGVIILNFGSIASFISFTRTDILELRLLSITGSLSSVCYFALRPPPIVYGPIFWSSIFAGTNSFMVYHIYEERKGKPRQWSLEEQDVYDEHMLSHAVTPRQFEKMLKIVKKKVLEKNEVLVQKGQIVNKVHLVVSGSTEAYSYEYKSSNNSNFNNMKLSRRVTAASSKFGNKEKLQGGDSGAWIGELAFLDYLSARDKAKKGIGIPKLSNKGQKSLPDIETVGEFQTKETTINYKKTQNAFLSYVATERSIVYEWDFEELAELMKTSSDLRSAVTRAMTAAVVGKVVNMYISKADVNLPTWKKWIAGKFSDKDNISAVKINLSQD